jgi:hypothetical protein
MTWDRGVNAANNMLILLKYELNGNERPRELKTPFKK